MKKFVSILIAAALSFSVTACGSGDGGSTEEQPEASVYEVAMITDMGRIDDNSFNRSSWEGVLAFAEEHGVTHKYYRPAESSTDGYLRAIKEAADGGAKVIIASGYMFQNSVFIAQDEYPDVHFILVDGNPASEDGTIRINGNAVGIEFAEEQAGYLAGYAAVRDGNTKLGFMGGVKVPAVVRYGYGFAQGASAAARETGVSGVELMYGYMNTFNESPDIEEMAEAWYDGGTEIIFACGGALGNSVMAAAERKGTAVIGVDVDQSGLSDTVVTSAMKGITAAVIQTLSDYYAGNFPGGETIVLGADKDGVKLPMAASKFNTFSEDDYNEVYNELAENEIEIMRHDGAESVTGLGLNNVNITVVTVE